MSRLQYALSASFLISMFLGMGVGILIDDGYEFILSITLITLGLIVYWLANAKLKGDL